MRALKMKFEGRQFGRVWPWLLLPFTLLGLLAAGLILIAVQTWQPEPATDTQVTEQATISTVERELTADQQATFDRTCKLCHGNKGTGAPVTGDSEAWAARLQQGIDKLLDHTVNGHGGMPPMGMCMECDQAQFVAFIEYMGQFDSGLECE